jgi:hypothetical protein
MRVLPGSAVAIAGAMLLAGCGSSRPAGTTTTGVSLASPRAQQIALARSSSPLFAIFPAKPGERTCTIPGGGMRRAPLRGICMTHIRPARTHEPELIVTFMEVWPRVPCPRGGDCLNSVLLHTWSVRETEPIVTTGARLRVWPSQQSGAPAPQYYK